MRIIMMQSKTSVPRSQILSPRLRASIIIIISYFVQAFILFLDQPYNDFTAVDVTGTYTIGQIELSRM